MHLFPGSWARVFDPAPFLVVDQRLYVCMYVSTWLRSNKIKDISAIELPPITRWGRTAWRSRRRLWACSSAYSIAARSPSRSVCSTDLPCHCHCHQVNQLLLMRGKKKIHAWWNIQFNRWWWYISLRSCGEEASYQYHTVSNGNRRKCGHAVARGLKIVLKCPVVLAIHGALRITTTQLLILLAELLQSLL